MRSRWLWISLRSSAGVGGGTVQIYAGSTPTTAASAKRGIGPRIGPSVEVAPRSGQPYRPGAALADDRPLKFFRHVAFVLQTLVQLLVLHPPGVGSRRGEDEEALPLFAFVSLLATEADVSSADLNGTDQPLRSGSQISRTLPMNPSGSAHQEMRKTSSTAAACRSARRMPGQPSRGEKRTVPAH
jgi:hypothetical protein